MLQLHSDGLYYNNDVQVLTLKTYKYDSEWFVSVWMGVYVLAIVN